MSTALKEQRSAELRSRRRAPAVPGPRAPGARLTYLDNLKVLLVAAIIAAHGIAAYSDLESAWPYQDVQEVQLGTVSNAVLSLLALPAVLFVMGLFFLISGLVTPGSVVRKGPKRFARDRLVRLGVPVVVWALVIWAGAKWVVYQVGGETSSFWWRFVHSDPFLDTGPMWFVEVLLVYSLAYAAWRLWRGRPAEVADRPLAPGAAVPLTGRTLVAVGLAVSIGTVLVRLVFPLLSGQIGQSHLWQWPQFLAMFGLGIVAAQRGWLTPVPDRIRRGCGHAAVLGVLAFLSLAGTMVLIDVDPDVWFEERLHWAPIVLAAIEGPLAIGFGIWMLGVAQRRLDRRPGRFGRAMTRSAYAAFILQGVVLIGLMLALRPVGLPAEVKALAVAALGVALSFASGWLLVSRTSVGRVI
jgi:hypothetical protein